MFKKVAQLGVLTFISLAVFSCNSSSKNKNAIVTNDVTIPFMAHAGATHLSCGVEMSQLGTSEESGFMSDFRFFIHDVVLLDEEGEEYPIKLKDNDWQTENVTLLSFNNKENCLENSGESLTTNMKVQGKYEAPKDAVITALKFKIGVPFELNHKDPTQADAPLNTPGMQWNWQGGYKHMRIEAEINENSFIFHLGSVGCDGSPTEGGTTSCNRDNRPEISLKNFDIEMSAVQFDFQALVENLDVNGGGACHSAAGQAATCQGAFDSLGLDFYDGENTTIQQANEGQTVFKAVMNHN